MLNFGCQPCSLYSEDFFCSPLKLFGSIRIAYSFYNQTLVGYKQRQSAVKKYNIFDRTLVFKIHNPVVLYSENKATSTPLIKPA